MTVYRTVQWMDPDTDEIIFEDLMSQEEFAAKFWESRRGFTCDVRLYWPNPNTPKPETITSVTIEGLIT